MEIHDWHNTFPVQHAVIESEDFEYLDLSSKVLYCYLAKLSNRFANKDRWFYRSMNDLAKDSGLHINSIKKAKKELKRKGLIEVEPHKYTRLGKRLADGYRLVSKNKTVVQEKA